MAWYIRKAKKVGLLRFNLSKSGIGLSGGLTGARLGVNSKGQTYVHFGRHGLYYRKHLKPPLGSKKVPADPKATESIPYASAEKEIFESGNMENLTDVDSKSFVEELQKKDRKIELKKWIGYYPGVIILILVLVFAFQQIGLDNVYADEIKIERAVVNIRAEPNTSSEVVHKAASGDTFEIINEQDDWKQVKYSTPQS